jgi:hypothetical protein
VDRLAKAGDNSNSASLFMGTMFLGVSSREQAYGTMGCGGAYLEEGE